jgi:HPt (histidine-containing phosphotransfer) domain-containing protein
MDIQYKQIDLSYLKQMEADTGAGVMKEMIELFKETVPELVAWMDKAIANKDWNDLSEAAHKAKSNITIMGMNSMAADLKQLEIWAKSNQEIEKYTDIVNRFKAVVAEALKESDEVISRL